jgi:hypothetical protein
LPAVIKEPYLQQEVVRGTLVNPGHHAGYVDTSVRRMEFQHAGIKVHKSRYYFFFPNGVLVAQYCSPYGAKSKLNKGSL